MGVKSRKFGNHAYEPSPPLAEGDVVEGGNFCQAIPGTEICAEIENLTIRGGNFTNVAAQPTWLIEGGNFAQVDFCSHERPDLVEHNLLRICPRDCVHRLAIDEWGEVTEDEFRRLARAGADRATLRVVTDPTADADGIEPRRFDHRQDRYASRRVD